MKKIYGVGYNSVGEYKVSIDGKHTIQYKYWFSIIRRCYDEKSLQKYPTYKDCKVCQEWLDFQVFAKWFDSNYYEIENDRMQLDKDILCKNNKVYSPKKCVFVPQRINNLFTKRQNERGIYPIGVNYINHLNKFQARCNTLNERVNLGYFDFPEQAFYEGYKPFKEAYIKQVAEEYKEVIPFELYQAMYKYTISITD